MLPFTFGEEPSNYGDMIGVQCMAPKGDLPIEIRWTLNSAPIINGEDGFSLLKVNSRTSSLNIESLERKHRGIYKCIATNKAGNTEFSSELQVNVPPQIMPFSFGEESYNSGDSIGTQCMIMKGDLPIIIKWTLNSRPIVTGEDGITVLKLSPKTSVLNIASVQGEHRGIFKCIAENSAGYAEYSSELKVNVPPQIMPFSFGEESYNSGDSVGVQCMIVKGDIPITIKWTLNSRPVVTGEDGISVLKLSPKISVLNIAAIEGSHRGIYKCIAENIAGSSEHRSELKVNGVKMFLIMF